MEKSHSQQIGQSNWWDWAAIGLLLLLLQTVASRLLATTWTPFLYLVQRFTLLGFIIGAALGYSRFQRGTTRWLSFLYMLILLPLEWTLIIDQQTSLEEQLLSVGGRLFYSTSDFLARRPVQDPIFFVAIMSIAFWVISSAAAFTLVRHQNYLGAVLPAAIGLLIIQNYDNGNASRLWFLAAYALIALLLLGRLQFLQNKISWRERHVFLSPDNSFDLTSSMAVAAGLIILVAWTVPATISSMDSAVKAWDRITHPWQDFQQRMQNAVSALESKSTRRGGEYFSTELALGRGFPLSDNIVFQVHVPVTADQTPPRYYWRGRVYDYYTNDQWYTTGTTQQDFSPKAGPVAVAGTSENKPQHFVIDVGTTRFALLYGPSQPVWFSRSGSILSSPAGKDKDVFSWNASPTLQPGEQYQVEATLINPSIQELRAAGTQYPAWVTSRYLQLPKNFSPRISKLASDVTAQFNDPYDKAVAVTSYLRQNIQYEAKLPQPPVNRDLLEWVLFDHKKAYCVYDATSEVLMLRSLGIPARMAVGFAQGAGFTENKNESEDNSVPSRYVVREKNAHAWPEVYFPGIGWVEFEPTANQAPLDRPAEQQNVDAGNTSNPQRNLLKEENQIPDSNQPLDVPPDTFANSRIALYFYLLPLFAVIVGLMVFLGRRYAVALYAPVFVHAVFERTGIEVPAWVVRWEKWMKLTPIEKAFESINFGLRQLDRPVPIHVTPIERATKLTNILPEKADQIKVLLDEHQTSLYTSRVADVDQARRAAFDIRKQVILERIRYIFQGKPLQ